MPDPASPSPSLTDTYSYFQPPQDYFWHWAEDNAVVEWVNGTTITYREELASLLTSLAPGGLPPLGAVLLVLAACTSSWQESTEEIGILQGVANNLSHTSPPADELRFYIRVAIGFLDIVRELPPELRQGTAKEHLLREVLGATERQVPTREAQLLAQQLSQPDELIDPAVFSPVPSLSGLLFRRDLLYFDRAAQQFPTVHSLELRLRTGLAQLPEPLPEVPAPPPSPEPPADLLAELAADDQTAGLAQLVPHLRAALHLPQPARQAGNQPLGGVADLANHGPLDRLLLSELAQDDLSLLARLAHGEALYLRREAPPLPQPLPRVLLLDTTLQMWGLPRVAGLAAALALAPGTSQPAPLAFALGGRTAQLLDLQTKPGVVAALGLLDPALHCGEALLAGLPTLPATAEALLITEAQAARQPGFVAFLQVAPPALRFLLTVARGGELVLHELAGGRRRILSSTRVDLEAALFAPRKAAPHPLGTLALPAFFKQPMPPLFFPTVSFQPRGTELHYETGRGAIGVTQQLRVLYWPHAYLGALEALPVVEEGSYHVGFSSKHARTIYLLVTQPDKSKTPVLVLYTLKPWEPGWERVDLLPTLPTTATWSIIIYQEDTFIFKQGLLAFTLDCQQPATLAQARATSFALPVLPGTNPPPGYFNPGYKVLQIVDQLAISQTGYLLLGGYELVPTPDAQLTWRPASMPPAGSQPAVAAVSAGTHPLAVNSRVRLRRWVWADGSEAFADSRGLLHLRSADAALPELTVVLAIGRGTAAWAASGQKCGWSYFTRQILKADPKQWEILPVGEFYSQYLQPLLGHLR